MASAGRALVCGGGALGSAAVAVEFSTLHLRSSFIAGGMAMMADFYTLSRTESCVNAYDRKVENRQVKLLCAEKVYSILNKKIFNSQKSVDEIKRRL